MKIKRDQNDLCKSLEESVEHSSKFMVLCIQPWTVPWTHASVQYYRGKEEVCKVVCGVELLNVS